ncbi:MAG: hypothetical protein KatS3mg018_1119 [Fimbriimonadales bacterium]|nr:MAG: hypothetical protein KatS3mg018_1119 [Fimbriimonadales bacterium]
MTVKGTVRGKTIELDEPLPLAEGARVQRRPLLQILDRAAVLPAPLTFVRKVVQRPDCQRRRVRPHRGRLRLRERQQYLQRLQRVAPQVQLLRLLAALCGAHYRPGVTVAHQRPRVVSHRL